MLIIKHPVTTETKHMGTDQHGRPFHKPVLTTALRTTGNTHTHMQAPLLIAETCVYWHNTVMTASLWEGFDKNRNKLYLEVRHLVRKQNQRDVKENLTGFTQRDCQERSKTTRNRIKPYTLHGTDKDCHLRVLVTSWEQFTCQLNNRRHWNAKDVLLSQPSTKLGVWLRQPHGRETERQTDRQADR